MIIIIKVRINLVKIKEITLNKNKKVEIKMNLGHQLLKKEKDMIKDNRDQDLLFIETKMLEKIDLDQDLLKRMIKNKGLNLDQDQIRREIKIKRKKKIKTKKTMIVAIAKESTKVQSIKNIKIGIDYHLLSNIFDIN